MGTITSLRGQGPVVGNTSVAVTHLAHFPYSPILVGNPPTVRLGSKCRISEAPRKEGIVRRLCGWSSVMAGLLGSLLMLMTGMSVAQDNSQPERERAAVVKAAMVFEFRQSRDPWPLAEQLYTVALHSQGVPHEEIVHRALQKRREWASLRRAAVEGDWRASRHVEKYKTVTRFLGGAATQWSGRGTIGVEFSNLVIQYVEDFAARRALPRAAQRFADGFRDWEKRFASSEGYVFDAVDSYYQNDSEYRKAWDLLFLSKYGIRPSDSVQAVLEKSPNFALHSRISEILQISHDAKLLAEKIHAQNGEILEEMADVRRRHQEMGDAEAQRRRAQRDAQIERIDMEGYRAAAGLAATFVGFKDPKLGRQLHVTSTAVLSALDGVKAYERALAIGANPNLARLALTGNIVTGGLAIMAAFQDSGETADLIIIEEIASLRKEVQEIRKEMHVRFDGVHDHLEGIYGSMIEGFKVLEENDKDNADKLESVADNIDSIILKLDNIAAMQFDTQFILVRQGEMLYSTIAGFHLAECRTDYGADEYPEHTEQPWTTRLSTFFSTRDDDGLMDFGTFRRCRSKIETLHRHLSGFQLYLESSTALARWLGTRPDRTISQSFTEFKRLLEASNLEGSRGGIGLSDSVVGPVAWFHVADTHDRFLAKHPEHAARVTPEFDTT